MLMSTVVCSTEIVVHVIYIYTFHFLCTRNMGSENYVLVPDIPNKYQEGAEIKNVNTKKGQKYQEGAEIPKKYQEGKLRYFCRKLRISH